MCVFDGDFFDAVVPPDAPPATRLLEVLLWRGFLVEQVRGNVMLCRGSHDRDAITLAGLGLAVEPVTGDPGHLARIRLAAGCDEGHALRSVFLLPPQNGMAGPFDWGGRVNDGFQTFRRLRYGVKVPAVHLDPGVALLVKALPLCGVHTVMSCDGHTRQSPHVCLFSDIHLLWCRAVVREVLRRHPVPGTDGWRFGQDGDGWMSRRWLLGEGGSGPGLAGRLAAYRPIQSFARVLMRPDVGPRARRAKQAAGCPGDFADALARSFDEPI